MEEHLSEQSIEELYAFGYGFYESGNYDKAVTFFRFLTLIDIGTRKHWMGLGASYQMLKNYDQALQCYGQAALLDHTDPYAHWHAAECFLAQNNTQQAKEALNSVEITAKSDPKRYQTLLERVQILNLEKAVKHGKSQSSFRPQ